MRGDPRRRRRRRRSASGSGRPPRPHHARLRGAAPAASALQKSVTLSPRKPPTSAQPGEMSRPAAGRPMRTYASHAARATRCSGTPNSSPAIVPPRLDDACQLGEGRRGIVDVAKEVRERERVERRVRERQMIRVAVDELDLGRDSLARHREHLHALVEARPRGNPSGVRARSRPCRCPWRRRARCRPAPAAVRSTRKLRQRPSWPNESSRA